MTASKLLSIEVSTDQLGKVQQQEEGKFADILVNRRVNLQNVKVSEEIKLVFVTFVPNTCKYFHLILETLDPQI